MDMWQVSLVLALALLTVARLIEVVGVGATNFQLKKGYEILNFSIEKQRLWLENYKVSYNITNNYKYKGKSKMSFEEL